MRAKTSFQALFFTDRATVDDSSLAAAAFNQLSRRRPRGVVGTSRRDVHSARVISQRGALFSSAGGWEIILAEWQLCGVDLAARRPYLSPCAVGKGTITLPAPMGFSRKCTIFSVLASVGLFCSCDRHRLGEMPEVQKEHKYPETKSDAEPAASAAHTPAAKPTPADFFPESTPR